MTPQVTLALPAYNEAENIATVIQDAVRALDRLGRSWELLVIDNHSSDATCAVAERVAAADERIRVIRHGENRLYSGSCLTAMREARGDIVAIMDSDGQATAEDLPKFIEKLEGGADLVIGWRRERHDPLSRLLMSSVFNLLARWYISFSLHDLNCGYRAFGRRFIDVGDIKHRMNLVNPELYVRARMAHLAVEEVIVRHSERTAGRSSHDFGKLFRVFLDVRRYFAQLAQELRQIPREAVTTRPQPTRGRDPGGRPLP